MNSIGLNPQDPVGLKNLVDETLGRGSPIQQRRDDLFRLDRALCHLDLKWINRTHGFRLTQLTLAQRKLMQENITEERRRTKIAEAIELVGLEIDIHVTAIQDSLRSARQCLKREDIAGTVGWTYKALQERERAPEFVEKTLIIERRLLMLLMREGEELTESPSKRCQRLAGKSG